MPKRKSMQENGYVPLTADSAKHGIEIPVKEINEKDMEKIEKKGTKKIRTRKKTQTKKTSRITRTKKTEKVKPTKTTRKTGEYALIITEKPQASSKVAYALSSSAKKHVDQGVAYYELERNSEKIVIACAVGHLFTLTQRKKGSSWPVFDIEWKPNFEVRKQDWSKKYYNVLTKLCKKAKSCIIACDYDIEGEVIGLNILRFICHQEDGKRMKFSTLTASELQRAYEHLMPGIDWGQAIAGETRHYLDWMYGINLSRALMNAIKKAGSFRIMSIGRVQGPALHLVVEKELAIKSFKPKPYWQIFILINDGRNKTELKYYKDVTKKLELGKFKDLEGKEIDVKTQKKEQKILPPVPFDLTTLQIEAYKFYRITPSRTLQVAQNLYLSGLISYPRTSSQKISEAISPKKILERLGRKFEQVKYAKRQKPIEGHKSDPAHPSIYPTGEYQELIGEDKKLYELIVKRFISCFCPDALIENKTITALKDKLKFFTKGLQIKEKGWMNVYPASLQEKKLPDIDGKARIKKLREEEKMTQPPRRYSPASLVSELSKRNLGTKATRAAIVETLYNRGYIREQRIEATPLGLSLISSLEKYSPIIIDEKLTRNFEKQMQEIQTTKKNLESKEHQIINGAKKVIAKISEEFKDNEDKIGGELLEAHKNLIEEERKKNKLTKCPVCKKGDLIIIYSRKTRKKFVACNQYPKCKTTFSLPQNGLIKKTDKICECGFPILMLIRKGKRPWFFCFNPNCSKKQKEEREEGKNQDNTEK